MKSQKRCSIYPYERGIDPTQPRAGFGLSRDPRVHVKSSSLSNPLTPKASPLPVATHFD